MAPLMGILYLLLLLASPIRLIYIPSKLFVHGNATATANNTWMQVGFTYPGLVSFRRGSPPVQEGLHVSTGFGKEGCSSERPCSDLYEDR